jgi:hypothetical protein
MPNDVRRRDYRTLAEINAVSTERPNEWVGPNDADCVNSQIIFGTLCMRRRRCEQQRRRNNQQRSYSHRLPNISLSSVQIAQYERKPVYPKFG